VSLFGSFHSPVRTLRVGLIQALGRTAVFPHMEVFMSRALAALLAVSALAGEITAALRREVVRHGV